MKGYSAHGFDEFVLALGYKGEMIKEYFLNYEARMNDFTIHLGPQSRVEYFPDHAEVDWQSPLVDPSMAFWLLPAPACDKQHEPRCRVDRPCPVARAWERHEISLPWSDSRPPG
jgi:hypothetical protein